MASVLPFDIGSSFVVLENPVFAILSMENMVQHLTLPESKAQLQLPECNKDILKTFDACMNKLPHDFPLGQRQGEIQRLDGFFQDAIEGVGSSCAGTA